jgi:hypothetical protein
MLSVLFFACTREKGFEQAVPAITVMQSSVKQLKDTLKAQNISFKETLLFSEFDESQAEPDEQQKTILAVLNTGAYTEDAFRFILAVPQNTSGDPSLPYRIRAALKFIEKAQTVNTVEIFAAFLGENDLQTIKRGGDLPSFMEDESFFEENVHTVLWYFNSDETPRLLLIRRKTAETVSPLHIISGLPRLCQSLGVPFSFAAPSHKFYKFAESGDEAVLPFAQSREINALYLYGSDRGIPEAGSAVSEDAFAELAVAYALSLKNPGPSFDHHYLILPFFNKVVFLPETSLIVLVLLIFGACLLWFLIFSGLHRRKKK